MVRVWRRYSTFSQGTWSVRGAAPTTLATLAEEHRQRGGGITPSVRSESHPGSVRGGGKAGNITPRSGYVPSDAGSTTTTGTVSSQVAARTAAGVARAAAQGRARKRAAAAVAARPHTQCTIPTPCTLASCTA